MKKYSIIKPDPTLQANLMAWGFQCDMGWTPLIIELLDKLQAIVDAEPERYKDFEITEIKEKYGGLRVYTSIYTEQIEDLIDSYAYRAEETCEVCGEPGSLREHNHWWKTVCGKCYEDWIS